MRQIVRSVVNRKELDGGSVTVSSPQAGPFGHNRPDMIKKKALIAGATGVVGRNLLRHLLRTGEWEIVALSRRTPDVAGAYTHIGVDLMDAAECRERLAHLGDVTHVFFAALAAAREIVQAAIDNLLMLRN